MTEHALAIRPRSNGAVLREAPLGSAPDVMTLGRVMAESGFFADAKQAAQAVVKIMAGAEMGFGPVASMTGIYIVQGRVTLGANLIAAAIKRSGRYTYRVREWTDTSCRLAFYEGGEEIGTSDFTMDDAKRAELTKKSTWMQYPRALLFARAVSQGARVHCPDVFGGPVYAPEEMGMPVDEEGQVVAAVSAPAPRPAPQANHAPEVAGDATQEAEPDWQELAASPPANDEERRALLVRGISQLVDEIVAANPRIKPSPPRNDAPIAELESWLAEKRSAWSRSEHNPKNSKKE